LGVNPGFTHFEGPRGVLGSGSFSPLSTVNKEKKRKQLYTNQHRDIIIILYIYIYTGGGYIGGYIGYRGFLGYRPFIDSPLDRYIDMIDSMILWMRMCIWLIITT
jgi:hypothetical protein